MSIEIRHPAPEEYRAAMEATSIGFLNTADPDRLVAVFGPTWAPDRVWGAFDADRVCGMFRSWRTELTIPGARQIQAAAVTGVVVLPTHRRQGILTRMAAAAHAGMVDAGEPLAILIAAEYPIYGRFGYGPGTRDARLTIAARGAAVRGDRGGIVELAGHSAATRDAMRRVFNAVRLRRTGEIARRDVGWDLDTGLIERPFDGQRWSGFIALHRNAAGEVDGYTRYTAKEGERVADHELEVEELEALDDAAYADLWRYLLSVDLVAVVRAAHRPVTEPLPWLLQDARAVAIDRLRDVVWVRLFDIPRALEARAYERTASLVLEVVDEDAWGGTRRWRLDASPDGATCRATAEEPDLTVPVAALGAAYLGGTRLADAVRATGWQEHRPAALGAADALFRTLDEPWCATGF